MSDKESERQSRDRFEPIIKSGLLVNAFFILLLIWMIYLFVKSLAWTRIETWGFPVFSITLGALLTIIYLLKFNYPSLFDSYITRRETGEESPETELGDYGIGSVDARSRAEQRKISIIMIGWITALPVLMYFIGFSWALPLYLFSFIWYFRRDTKLAIALTVLFSIFTYVLFIWLVNTLWWDGILGLPDPIRFLP